VLNPVDKYAIDGPKKGRQNQVMDKLTNNKDVDTRTLKRNNSIDTELWMMKLVYEIIAPETKYGSTVMKSGVNFPEDKNFAIGAKAKKHRIVIPNELANRARRIILA
jgi:hypothetical protein